MLSGAISGLVFEDYNANGVYDTTSTIANTSAGSIATAIDRGLSGVVVTAYDNSGTVRGSATSASNGTYTLNATGTGPYRLQFTSLPSGAFDGTVGTNSKGTLQFVPDGNSSNVDLAVSFPNDYSQNNPVIATNQYIFGDQINGTYANNPSIVGFTESAGSAYGNTSGDYSQPTSLAFSIPADKVGTTFGLAANPATGILYAASYTKRFAGYGPNAGGTGTTDGAIYAINPTTGAVSILADLNSVFGPNTAGVDFRTQSGWSGYSTDGGNTGWDAVGKTSLGGMAISPDGQTLYVMNLADRNLYAIPTSGPINSSTVRHVSIPFNAPGATGTSNGTQAGDLRPFAVTYENGKLYIGIVNSAQSTQSKSDLKAYVYTVNPSTLAFSSSPVFQANLNYTRGQAAQFSGSGNPSAVWNPWSSTYQTLGSGSTSVYAQPMLSGIAFDANGDMILGLRDRNGDETGFFTDANQAKSTTTYEGDGAGDTLMAFINTPGDLSSGWTLENNGRGPSGQGAGPQNSGSGPGNASYYYQQNYAGFHSDVTGGGVLQIPGFPDIIVTAFDPGTTTVRTGGVRWLNETTGATDKAYQTYNTGFNQPPQPTFGKAEGTGNLASLTTAAPIEIGNRVFKDLNDNGIQDPSDPGIAGVTVHLYQGSTLVGTTTTDSTGQYLFNSTDVPGGLLPNIAYQIRFDNASDFSTGGPLNGLLPTIYGADPSGIAGSKAILSGTTPVINLTTGGAGANDHTLDAGFVQTAGISGTVYNDANNDGVDNNGEPPISGATVTLTGTNDQGNAVNLTTTTGSDGTYAFNGLRPSNSSGYTVTETLPTGYFVGKNSNGVDSLSISGIVATPGSSTSGVNFGNLVPSSLSGFVYADLNNDGVKQNGETGISGVTITLNGTDDQGNSVNLTTTTLGDGSYRFSNLRPSSGAGYSIAETQPSSYLDGKDTIGTPGGTTTNDHFNGIALASGVTGVNNNFGELIPASLSGYVYVDANNDGVKQSSEAILIGVVLTLAGVDDLGQTVNLTTTTGSNGLYTFSNLRPSGAAGYTITETQPAGYLDGKDTIGTPGGTTSNDQFSGVALTSGVAGTNNNFGELVPSSLSGFVYVDANNDGLKQGSEAGISGATVALTGVDDRGTSVNLTTTTASNGSYSFNNLRPSNGGGYSITETQPPGYLDGKDTIGTPGGTASNDQFSGVVLASGVAGSNNDFGELLPASLSGFVYVDANNDGVKQSGETGINGVSIALTGTDDRNNSVNLTTTTAANGAYQFANLRPGVYTVNETQPTAYSDGKDTAGTSGGTAGNDVVSSISLGSGVAASAYNFGERGAAISGTVFIDSNQNGTLDSAETGLGGVALTLLDGSSNIVGNTTSASDGSFSFPNLPAGSYTAVETTPTGYGTSTNTSVPVTLTTAGVSGLNYGVTLASLAGLVFTDVNSNGTYESGTDNVGPGGVVTLTGTDAAGNSVSRTTSTATDGTFLFSGLLAPNATGYTVTAQPYSGETASTATAGTAGGTAGTNNDQVTNIVPAAGTNATGYLYPELGAIVQGVVFDDLNTNGTLDPGEGGIPSVGIALTLSGGGSTYTATTDTNGNFIFSGVPAGTYDLTETVPAGYGTSTSTTHANLTVPASGVTGENFGLTTSSLAGVVFNDFNNNGTQEAGEPGISGVTVTVSGTDAGGSAVNQTTTTAADGSYLFIGLPAGTYSITETQPTAYNEGQDEAGTSLGSTSTQNIISVINLPVDTAATGYTFGERGSTLSGTTFDDADNDGLFDHGESAVGGVVVTLLDGSNNPIGTTTSASDGTYSFPNLPAGSYSVEITLPNGYGNSTPTTLPVNLTTSGASAENFGLVKSSLAGTVFLDANNNGIEDPSDVGIAGVTLTLTGTDANSQSVSLTTTTGSDGTYLFSNLLSGTYSVSETQPTAYGNGKTVAGTSGGAVGNDVVSGIDLGNATNAVGYNFGELGTVVSGTVFLDSNGNGMIDPSESGFSGTPVTVTLRNSSNQVVGTTTTASDGSYLFPNVVAGSYTVVETPPNGYGTSSPTSLPITVSTTSVTNNNFGVTTSSLSGFTYFDRNANLVFDGTDTAGANRDVTLTGTDANGDPVNLSAVTGSDGYFHFNGLLSGTYTVNVAAYPGLNLETATVGTAGGTAGANNDTVSGIDLLVGTAATGYQFPQSGEIVSGTVYFDSNRNGQFDGGDAGIPGTTVTLSGTNNKTGAPYSITTVTDGDGFYMFATPSKTVNLTVTLPPGYTADTPTTINASVPADGLAGQDFGFTSASLAGQVFVDNNNDGIRQSIEPPIPNVTITLDGTETQGGASVHLTTVTGDDGSYLFSGLGAGTYAITETQPAAYLDGKDSLGTAGGTLGNDSDTSIPLAAGQTGTGYDFGELTPASLAGTVYADTNNNGQIDTGETGISGVVLTLTGVDHLGNAVNLTTTTDSSGNYAFSVLQASDSNGYTITETQPTGYFDGKDLVGSQGGTLGNDVISQIVLGAGIAGTSNDFGELPPATVTGHVFVDVNDNRVDNNEPGLAGVTITLNGLDDLGNTVNLTTTTASDGTYTFNNLRPSDADGYTVAEPNQPSGYLDGLAANTSLSSPNLISGVIVGAGATASDVDFAELLPASLSGFVYSDANNDGVKQDDEPGIAGVTVTLTGFDDQRKAVKLTTTTDANGFYSFTNLRPSLNDQRAALVIGYTITETQPAAYQDGIDTIGTPGGTTGNDLYSGITLLEGVSGTNNNFGEIPNTPTPTPTPTPPGSVLTGYVYIDVNKNGIKDSTDTTLPGVTVTLDGVSSDGAQVQRMTISDSNGFYRFDDLPVGVYNLTESQPAGYASGQSNSGTLGGNGFTDTIKGISVGEGVAGENYNFGQVIASELEGRVYLDLNKNGRLDDGEFGIAQIKITLTGTDSLGDKVNLSQVTSPDGSYDFNNLEPGVYRLEITRPTALFANGRINPGSPEAKVTTNAIVGIVLPTGVSIPNNNFGEVIRQGCRLNTPAFQRLLKLGSNLSTEESSGLAGPRWNSNGPIAHFLPTLKDSTSPAEARSAAIANSISIREAFAVEKRASSRSVSANETTGATAERSTAEQAPEQTRLTRLAQRRKPEIVP